MDRRREHPSAWAGASLDSDADDRLIGTWRAWMRFVLLAASVSMWTGCWAGPPTSTGEDAGDDYGDPAVAVGRADVLGLYPDVVTVMGGCSGTLVASNRVLTAAHCFCVEHTAPDGAIVNDPTRCATRSWVEFHTADGRHERFGEVIVHPDFLFRIMPAGISPRDAHRDLAVLILEEPAPEGVAPRSLSDRIPMVGEAFTGIGFGQYLCHVYGFGTRRYGSVAVTEVRSDLGAFRAHRSGFLDPLASRGDSGGPATSTDGRVTGVMSLVRCTGAMDQTAAWENITPEWAQYTTVHPNQDWILRHCPGDICSIRILSPSTETTWRQGFTYRLDWESHHVNTPLRIVIVDESGHELRPIRTDAPASGSQAITVYSDWVPGDYRICITGATEESTQCSSRIAILPASSGTEIDIQFRIDPSPEYGWLDTNDYRVYGDRWGESIVCINTGTYDSLDLGSGWRVCRVQESELELMGDHGFVVRFRSANSAHPGDLASAYNVNWSDPSAPVDCQTTPGVAVSAVRVGSFPIGLSVVPHAGGCRHSY